MRHLATIQTIKSITPIPNADRIELAHVLGWQCVVKKGEYQQGDKAVYFEVDSFLPEKEEFEFLRSSSFRDNKYMGRGFKLKTQTFRGEISQGLLMRPTDLGLEENLPDGTDVTDILGVRKWEVPEVVGNSGTMIGDCPDIIPKTDETRIQSIPEILEEFRGIPYYITTKMDGTSCSIAIDDDGRFRLSGHNFEFKDDPETSSFVKYIRDRGVEEKLRSYMAANPHIKNIVLQGELCGEGIQKNRLKLKKAEWFVFTVNINGKRTSLYVLEEVCKAAGVTMVPLEEEDEDLIEKYKTVEDLLDRANGQYPNGGPKEGIVIRPVEPKYSETLSGPLSLKVLNNKYLLKHDN